MEDQFFEKIPGLEKLLESRNFEDLTSLEKEEILHYMSPEDYQKYRQTIQKSKALFISEQKKIKANPAIRKRLLERWEQQETSSKKGMFSALWRILAFRIPAYQPGFAVAVLAILFFLLHNEKPDTIRYLTKIDTIYAEKKIAQSEDTDKIQDSTSKPDKKNDIKEGTGLKEKPGPKTDRRSVPSQNQYVQNAYQKIRIVNLKQAGRSATDDSALMKFLVTAN